MPSGLGWNSLFLPPASNEVTTQFSWFTDKAVDFTEQAKSFISQLEDFTITPIDLVAPTFDEDLTFTPFMPPEIVPAFEPDGADDIDVDLPGFGANITEPDFGRLTSVNKPAVNLPPQPNVNIPTAPTLSPIDFDPTPPTLEDIQTPQAGTYLLPEVPTLESLNLPTAPVIDFDQFAVTRPEFTDPTSELYDNDYVRNANESRAAIFTQVDDAFITAQNEHNLRNVDGDKALTRIGAMLDGGTGLPPAVEQALFDRGISREEISSQQSVVQSYDEWASRGFTLPGASLLAAVREARQRNRDNRGQINRDITIQFHQQEIDNLRFAVQQGIALQGQVFDQYIQMHTSGREMADRAFDVARAIFDARLEIFRVQLQIYQADIEAFRERLQAELAKLEIFRAELQAEQVRGEINEQRVRIYVARLQAVDTQVGIFRSQVEAANSQIEAQKSKVELFQGRIDAYKTSLEGERVKFDIFDTQVNAEQSKAQVYEAQVRGFAEALRGYDTEARVEIAKIDARNRDNEARLGRYRTEVDIWAQQNAAKLSKLEALTDVFQANISKYNAELGAEQFRLQGESRNKELILEQERAKLAARLKVGDQRIEEMRHATSLGLESITTAATVLAQLAASAMSAVNVSAGISNSLNSSSSWSSSYNESGTGE